MRQTHTVWGQGYTRAEAWAVGGTAGSGLAAAVAPLNAPAPSRPRSRLPFSGRRGRQGLAAGRVCSLPLPRWAGPALLPAGAAGSRAGGGESERRAAVGRRGAVRGGGRPRASGRAGTAGSGPAPGADGWPGSRSLAEALPELGRAAGAVAARARRPRPPRWPRGLRPRRR